MERLVLPAKAKNIPYFSDNTQVCGYVDTSFWPILNYPEFSELNPSNEPSINLTATGKTSATSELKVVWADNPRLMWAICLDHSGSMNETDLANAKANAKRTIDMAPAGTLVGIFAFADNAREVVPFAEVTDANRATLKKSVDSLTPGGNTALWKAADVALNRMNALDPEHNNIGSILLLTDGGDNASGNITRGTVVAKCQSMGVAFNSISYGNNADSELGAISSATGGRNVSSSDSLSSLSDAFSRLLTYGSSRETIDDSKGTVTANAVWTEPFVVDSAVTNMQVTVTLSVPSRQATVVLLSPTGTRYAANSSTDVGSESSFVFLRTSPVAGQWTVSVSAPVETEVSCYVDASSCKNPPRLQLWVDDCDTAAYASLSYGDPVDGAVVKALLHENGMTREVPFEPIGAGMYKVNLADCGAFSDGFTVRADATKGVATYTYIGIFDYEGDGEGTPIPENFTRSEWLDLSHLKGIPVRFVFAHPRWPWEGKVDIDFTVAPSNSNTKVSVTLVGVDGTSSDRFAISTVECDDMLSDLGAGKHRLTWNAAADVPGKDFEDFSIRFDVTTGTAVGAVTELTASAGTYFDGVHVSWNAASGATGYRVYRSETTDGSGKKLLTTQSGRTYTDSTATIGKKYYYYWVQPIAAGTNGTVKHEGPLAVSSGGWRGQLGGISGLNASGGSHYDGVHVAWTGPNGATQYRIYRGTTANSSAKSLLATTSSTSYIDTTAAKLQS